MRISGNKLKHLVDFFQSELRGIYPDSEIEAMMLFAMESILGYSKTETYQKLEENINQSDLLKLYDCAKDLKKHIPLQYILGETWFYNLKFKVNKHVLIPRPETEELVELVLKENKGNLSILDIGTGSGCIPITLKNNLKESAVSACDISKDALDLAKKNAELNETTIDFFATDILKNQINNQFDIIISNPPYIKEKEKELMEKNVLDHEPHLALFVKGEDSIIFYKKIIDLCSTSLSKKGKLYFELNPLTAEAVEEYAKNSNLFENTHLIKDMSGALRFFKGIKN
ncbi:peptide chain release factor N(5)-glutamine methyltransferase [Aurantibacillus circumpalustris]|uniref:peptide chain release factor N(5)-glutamine methyltransferase n=1 Tax=Aurantibacillus circumpalustris TaxID=3036359 RepID=UPI00295BDDCB|nr:peptide chain release factor N(5)-glutamine methyltransferase [Aurantibacillus circumpalustris]